MTREHVVAAGTTLAVLLSACTGAEGESPGFAVRDSAGIQIVENASPAWNAERTWTVAAEPALEIGMVEGPAAYQLDGVTGALRLADGRIAVANGGSREIRLFDATGRYLRSAGGEGAGPGEFQSLNWIAVREDSILAWDPRAKRLSVFTSNGEFVREATASVVASSLFPMAVGTIGGGSLLLTSGSNPVSVAAAPGGEIRETRVYLRVDFNGVGADTLVTLPGPEAWLEKGDGSFSVIALLFGRESYIATASDRIYAGDNDRYEIQVLGPDGALSRLIRRSVEPVPVQPGDLDAEREARLAAISGAPRPAIAGMSAALRAIPHRETLPAFARLTSDAEGNLWVEESRPPGDDQPRWSVFDTDGRWLGAVETPPGLRILQIGPDFLLGTWKDDLDVQYVRLHSLRKPTG